MGLNSLVMGGVAGGTLRLRDVLRDRVVMPGSSRYEPLTSRP